MAKKATTIILVIVVLFLLASTVYVSIILTSDTGTTPRPSKASEIEEGVEAVPVDETVVEGTDPEETTADPLSVAEDQASQETGDQSLVAQESLSAPEDSAEEIEDVSITPEVTSGEDDELLAYANPSPTGGAAGTNITPTAKVTAGLESSVDIVDELPESGNGQPKTTKTPTPTKVQQQLPQTMPVAGNLTGPIAAFVVAGTTIVLSFLF